MHYCRTSLPLIGGRKRGGGGGGFCTQQPSMKTAAFFSNSRKLYLILKLKNSLTFYLIWVDMHFKLPMLLI